jgi:hypothetical protein
MFPCSVCGKALSFLCKVAITEYSRLLRYYSALSGINLFVFRKKSSASIFRAEEILFCPEVWEVHMNLQYQCSEDPMFAKQGQLACSCRFCCKTLKRVPSLSNELSLDKINKTDFYKNWSIIFKNRYF